MLLEYDEQTEEQTEKSSVKEQINITQFDMIRPSEPPLTHKMIISKGPENTRLIYTIPFKAVGIDIDPKPNPKFFALCSIITIRNEDLEKDWSAKELLEIFC